MAFCNGESFNPLGIMGSSVGSIPVNEIKSSAAISHAFTILILVLFFNTNKIVAKVNEDKRMVEIFCLQKILPDLD